MSLKSIVIGIDLGTTNSCASYYIDGRTQILENSEGGRTTPSFIFFTEDSSHIIGQYAKPAADQKPENGVYEMKRLLGRGFQDRRVQDKQKFFPFMIQAVDGKPVIRIETKKKTLFKTPQELSSLVLRKIKADVDKRLDSKVTKAVITVPAYFNSLQRKETLEAAKRAGFTVLKLFNEPNAAALNFYHESKNKCQFILVYDLGGGTFDVSILKKTGSRVEVLCVDGDSHLGGNDFDDLIVNFVCIELFVKYEWDERADKRKMRRLNLKCEEVKKMLSVTETADILLEAFVQGHDMVKVPFSRKQLEDLIGGLLQKTLDVTKRCINNSKINKKNIEQVILAGGSTRIPKIQNMLSQYFGAKIIKMTLNPDECVANGAALQAAMLSDNPRQRIEKTKIADVVPLSIGQLDIGGCMDFFIKKNTKIPVSVTKLFTNLVDQQSFIVFTIHEGERLDFRKNIELGKVSVKITPSPPRQCQVRLTIHIDSTGILSCTAEEEISGNRKKATIEFYTRGIRSDSEVRETITDADSNKAEDQAFRAYSSRIKYLRNYCEMVAYNLTIRRLNVYHDYVFDRCTEIAASLASDIFFFNRQTIDNVINELTGKCDALARSYHFELMPAKNYF